MAQKLFVTPQDDISQSSSSTSRQPSARQWLPYHAPPFYALRTMRANNVDPRSRIPFPPSRARPTATPTQPPTTNPTSSQPSSSRQRAPSSLSRLTIPPHNITHHHLNQSPIIHEREIHSGSDSDETSMPDLIPSEHVPGTVTFLNDIHTPPIITPSFENNTLSSPTESDTSVNYPNIDRAAEAALFAETDALAAQITALRSRTPNLPLLNPNRLPPDFYAPRAYFDSSEFERPDFEYMMQPEMNINIASQLPSSHNARNTTPSNPVPPTRPRLDNNSFDLMLAAASLTAQRDIAALEVDSRNPRNMHSGPRNFTSNDIRANARHSSAQNSVHPRSGLSRGFRRQYRSVNGIPDFALGNDSAALEDDVSWEDAPAELIDSENEGDGAVYVDPTIARGRTPREIPNQLGSIHRGVRSRLQHRQSQTQLNTNTNSNSNSSRTPQPLRNLNEPLNSTLHLQNLLDPRNAPRSPPQSYTPLPYPASRADPSSPSTHTRTNQPFNPITRNPIPSPSQPPHPPTPTASLHPTLLLGNPTPHSRSTLGSVALSSLNIEGRRNRVNSDSNNTSNQHYQTQTHNQTHNQTPTPTPTPTLETERRAIEAERDAINRERRVLERERRELLLERMERRVAAALERVRSLDRRVGYGVVPPPPGVGSRVVGPVGGVEMMVPYGVQTREPQGEEKEEDDVDVGGG